MKQCDSCIHKTVCSKQETYDKVLKQLEDIKTTSEISVKADCKYFKTDTMLLYKGQPYIGDYPFAQTMCNSNTLNK